MKKQEQKCRNITPSKYILIHKCPKQAEMQKYHHLEVKKCSTKSKYAEISPLGSIIQKGPRQSKNAEINKSKKAKISPLESTFNLGNIQTSNAEQSKNAKISPQCRNITPSKYKCPKQAEMQKYHHLEVKKCSTKSKYAGNITPGKYYTERSKAKQKCRNQQEQKGKNITPRKY